MDKYWEQLTASLVERIESMVAARLKDFLERFVRSEIKVIYDEREAAAFLKVSRVTLAAWRKAGLITYARYPMAKQDGLSDMYSYSVADLLNFRERYVHKTRTKNVFELSPVVTLAGPEAAPIAKAA